MVLAAFLLVGVILAAIVVASYGMSGKRAGRRQRLVDRWVGLVPLQSLKVVIVSWQILTQVRAFARGAKTTACDPGCAVWWQPGRKRLPRRLFALRSS